MQETDQSIRVREVGPRDGLQSIAQIMSTDDKIAWIEAEYLAGVCEIEVCSFVPPRMLPQFADAADVVRRALSISGLTVAVLVPNVRGAEHALAQGPHKINFVLSASEQHNLANVRRTREQSLVEFRGVSAIARGTSTHVVGGISTAFGCTLQGDVPVDDVLVLVDQLLEAGAQEIVLADTVGYADPTSVRALVGRVREAFGEVPLALHLHDTRGTGLANVVAGLDAGVRQFDAALGGMGGCPYAPGASGNIVTEDLVYLLESSGWATGIDIEALIGVRNVLVRSLVGVALHGSVARAGLPRNFSSRGPLGARTS